MNRVCHYYQAGSCRNGVSCPFYHPTKRCRNFNQAGWCPYGYNCLFWHDPSKKKAQGSASSLNQCAFYINDQCKYGDNCSFSHDIKMDKRIGQTLNEYQAVTKNLQALKLLRDTSISSCKNSLSGSVLSINGNDSDSSSKIISIDDTLCTPMDFDIKPVSAIPSHDSPQKSSYVENITANPSNRPAFERPIQIPTCVNSAEATDDEIYRLQTVEVGRLLNLFTEEKVKESVNPKGGRMFSVQFSSTDPDWGYDVREINLKIDIDLMYPKQPLVVTVYQEVCLPTILVEHLNLSIAAWIQKQHEYLQKNGRLEIYLKQFLQWLGRNLEELFTQGLRKFKNQLLNGLISKQTKASDTESATSLDDNGEIKYHDTSDSDVHTSLKSDQLNSDTETDYESSAYSPVDTDKVGERMQSLDSPKTDDPTATSVDTVQEQHQKEDEVSVRSEVPETHTLRLPDMRLLGSTGIYVQSRLYATMHCTRCRLPFEWYFNFHGNLPQLASSKGTDDPMKLTAHLRSLPPHRLACTRCRHPMALFFQANIAHAHDNLVGGFHLAGCVVDDIPFGHSSCILVCTDCHQYIKIKKLIPGRGAKRRCFSCNALIGLDFGRFLLESRIIRPGDVAASVCAQTAVKAEQDVSRRQRRSLKTSQNLVIKEGFPLPFFGACEHYRKSYRWLRFPCCGLLKPCDVCHDKAAGNSHEMELANRMVCGFCSKEQPFSSAQPCKSCHRSLTGSSSAHWEGGKGCRNKVTMSRKDAKKYSESSSKTVPKSSSKQINKLKK